jgi:hypothetical protein
MRHWTKWESNGSIRFPPYIYLHKSYILIVGLIIKPKITACIPTCGPITSKTLISGGMHPVVGPYYIKKMCVLVLHWYIFGLLRFGPLPMYRSILSTLIRPDTSMKFFSRYFGGFGQEYAPDTRRYAPILLWYVLEWNLYHVLYVAIAF